MRPRLQAPGYGGSWRFHLIHPTKFFDVHVVPIFNGGGGGPLGVSLTFVDKTRVQELQQQLNRSKQDLETAV